MENIISGYKSIEKLPKQNVALHNSNIDDDVTTQTERIKEICQNMINSLCEIFSNDELYENEKPKAYEFLNILIQMLMLSYDDNTSFFEFLSEELKIENFVSFLSTHIHNEEEVGIFLQILYLCYIKKCISHGETFIPNLLSIFFKMEPISPIRTISLCLILISENIQNQDLDIHEEGFFLHLKKFCFINPEIDQAIYYFLLNLFQRFANINTTIIDFVIHFNSKIPDNKLIPISIKLISTIAKSNSSEILDCNQFKILYKEIFHLNNLFFQGKLLKTVSNMNPPVFEIYFPFVENFIYSIIQDYTQLLSNSDGSLTDIIIINILRVINKFLFIDYEQALKLFFSLEKFNIFHLFILLCEESSLKVKVTISYTFSCFIQGIESIPLSLHEQVRSDNMYRIYASVITKILETDDSNIYYVLLCALLCNLKQICETNKVEKYRNALLENGIIDLIDDFYERHEDHDESLLVVFQDIKRLLAIDIDEQ
ncbi:hypothetical protein TRFO_07714 [Tritrichomonas foetus]|uniref:Uncharacterized protein n=1 Tax=Tritrichomonas foetus TaxID=1144522 RepID=A0A1J4JPF2_9EUKA|nr:hypothetical protein TRFO_07714 [Tritrichomonas foetus]|eukprot:OHT01039.1 hypothetical protein TRFO_07714 [Tritrichomonas foetus]